MFCNLSSWYIQRLPKIRLHVFQLINQIKKKKNPMKKNTAIYLEGQWNTACTKSYFFCWNLTFAGYYIHVDY